MEKQLIQTARSQAMDVYSAMLQAHERGVQYPKAYVGKILEGLGSKPNQPALHKSLHKKDDEPTELRPVTDEQRAEWDERERKIMAAGLLDRWEL